MRAWAWRPLLAGLWHAALLRAQGGDVASLVQGSVRAHGPVRTPRTARVDAGAPRPPTFQVFTAVTETALGPRVDTELGPILGKHVKSVTPGGYIIFKGIPYAEPPKRFAVPKPKIPWGPDVLEATTYRPSCVGSGVKGLQESEDCLFLNVWLPPGRLKGLPVIVYLHGGMNQHGSGHEPLRQGDLMVQSARYPVIFINFDFRLGLFGWIDLEDPAMPKNLGLRDQQMALRWVSRHVQAFGGDPGRVSLMGHSEGAGAVLAHMVSEGSLGLFQRATLHSPPADFFSRRTNRVRTASMLARLKCKRDEAKEVVGCLERRTAAKIWDADWVVEDLARDAGSAKWFGELGDVMKFLKSTDAKALPGYLGWHPVVDNDILLGEPRELIEQGRYQRVQVLITSSRNESLGTFSAGNGDGFSDSILAMAMSYFLRSGDADQVMQRYGESLRQSGEGLPPSPVELMLAMMTDKVWFCDILTLARDLNATGSDVRIGLFEHAPQWDPSGRRTNFLCEHGAACHGSEMFYILPQATERGGIPESLPEEIAFARRYRDEVLQFVSGKQSSWAPFVATSEPVTLKDSSGARVVEGFRREQCNVLDSSMGEALPGFMKRRSRHARSEQGLVGRTGESALEQ